MAGHWLHNWVPLDAEALKEKHHGHIPPGEKPGMTSSATGLTATPPGHMWVWDVTANKSRLVTTAEAAAGHQRYGRRTFRPGSPAAGEVDRRALALAREASGGAKGELPHQPPGLPPGYVVTHHGKVTAVGQPRKVGYLAGVSDKTTHPNVVIVRDPEGTERTYSTVREAVAASQEAHAANQPARRALTHEPIGKPGGPGVWHMKGAQYPAYFQHIRNDLMASGHPESEAHSLAWGILRNFAAGHDGKGNKVSAETQAKAVAALAEMRKLQAEAKATRSTPMAGSDTTYDADGLDGSWDDPSGLPDLTGLDVADFDAVAGPGGETLQRADRPWSTAPVGTGERFKKLTGELEARGAHNPGALAAWIGRRNLGKGKFAGLAGAARKRKGGAPAAAASRSRELYRTWPLEDCRIMRAAEGREYESGRVVEAYAAIYNTDAEIHDHEGHYIENIERSAFDQILREIHPDRNNGWWRVGVLYNHGMTVHGTPAERFSLPPGVSRHVSSEQLGLLTRTEYANTPLGDELLELVNLGALRTQSFTGDITRSSPQLHGPGDKYRARGGVLTRVRRLILGLREYGLTPFAAYTGAEVLGVRMQLPGSAYEPDIDGLGDGSPDYEGDPAGYPPGDGDPKPPSTGHRLYALRSQEMLERAGIELPPRG
jgi:phage head maturation protease